MIDCTLAVEREEYRALYEVLAKRRSSQLLRVALLFLSAVAAIAALMIAMPLFLGIFLLLCSASLLIWSVCYPSFQAWDAYRHRNKAADIAAFTYRFEDDALHILHPLCEQTVPYTAMTACVETETHFVLLADKQAFTIPKDVLEKRLDPLRDLLAERIAYKRVSVAKAPRRRATLALVTVLATAVLTIGVRGATYIRRPVTVTEGEHRITLSLPQFMQHKGGGKYVGNGIEAVVEYVPQSTMKEHIDAVLEKAPAANIANYATYLQKSEAVPSKGEWVAVSETEYYMSYADGSAYRYTVLRSDDDGVWIVWFCSPGERQDTYYNRFDTWREDIQN